MRTIFKCGLDVTDQQVISVPSVRTPLCVQMQGTFPCLWLQVDDESEPKPLRVFTFGTGQPIPDDATVYLGTYQLNSGILVFHVYTDDVG